jgi:hypothetical protein
VIDPAANTARVFATLRSWAPSIRIFITELVLEAVLKRYAIRYTTTFAAMLPLDLLALDLALWRAVRLLPQRDLRADLAVAAQALDPAGGGRRHRLGPFVTATASTPGLVIANWLTPRGWR